MGDCPRGESRAFNSPADSPHFVGDHKVAEAVSDPRGRVIWGTPKSHDRRSVPFPNFLEESLQSRCQDRRANDLVYTALDGGVLRNGNFRNRTFNPALARVQMEDPEFLKVTPHDLRHTAANLAVSVGASVEAVQRMLGHSSAAVTLDVSADLFDEDLIAVATAKPRQNDVNCVQNVATE
ncbi:site-specific integrase [Cryobacterium ruanii]